MDAPAGGRSAVSCPRGHAEMTACSESSGAEAETKWRFTAEVTIEPTASGDETVQHCDAADTLLLRRSRIDAPKRAALRLRGRTRSKHQDGRCGQGFDDLHGVTLHYAATGRNPLAGSGLCRLSVRCSSGLERARGLRQCPVLAESDRPCGISRPDGAWPGRSRAPQAPLKQLCNQADGRV